MPVSETAPLLSNHSSRPVHVYATIAAMGGLVCGYDTGSISGIIALPNFQERFFLYGSSAYYQSMLLASFLVTCMSGAFFSGYFCDHIGRKHSMLLGSCLLWVGISCELLGLNMLSLVLGRLISGTGTGLMTNAIPLYQSEIAPANIRGKLISLFALLSSFGQMIGYWVTYKSSYLELDLSWRMPWLVQMILCMLYIVLVCYLPFSPRWLIDKQREKEGLQVLSVIYNVPQDNTFIQQAAIEIKASIEAEKKTGDSCTFSELFQGSNLSRTCFAFFISVATCFTGNVVILYYAPQIFKQAGLSDISVSLALTGGIGCLSLLFTALSLQWWIDLWGRKALFFVGSVISAICMILIGCMFDFFIKVSNDDIILTNNSARLVIIACIYLFSAAHAGTWGVANYVYTAEIFSMRCRAKGLSLTYALSWACSIVITYCAPYCLAYSVSGVYYFFGLCSIITVFGIACMPETRGKTLEEIDIMFDK
ncbi:general substrate transporter [Gilbertella persicaria]|uniref:general substrate transporter n=1 Tax=Gilbertella persicaria TaxID=101096 RepID=UPI002220CC47|nr:general substrate transporter [Gilbertella persicaria]KAI8090898.1 general substrate transporter [Gilbertella persicaria]